MFTLAMQHGMVWVRTGMMPSNTQATNRNDINYLVVEWRNHPQIQVLKKALPGDLETAQQFGECVAKITKRWVAQN